MKKNLLRRFRSSRRGNVAMLFALTAPLMVGGFGFGVETGYLYYKQRDLQQAADVGAFAGASDLALGRSSSAAIATATQEARANGYDSTKGTHNVQQLSVSGQPSVRVTLTQNEPRFFTALFSTGTVTLNATATASTQQTGNACMLALSPTAARAAYFSGNGTTNLTGCSVMSNSNASDALYVWGSSLLTTQCAYAVGGAQIGSGNLTLTGCANTQTNAAPVADPYGHVTEPANPGSCQSGRSFNNVTGVAPGCYSNGLTLRGNTTLNAGVYYINGGTLQINSNANISGTNVMFVLANGATVSFNGTARVTLTADPTGANTGGAQYKGLLFFGSRNTASIGNNFNGNNQSSLTGAIYVPRGDLDFQGNFSGGSGGCMQIVAETFRMTGSTNATSNCTAAGLSQIPTSSRPRLVS